MVVVILPMKFYSSSLELSIIQTHILVYKLGCRSKISITTFFQIWICSIQIDFIAICRLERFYTGHDSWLTFICRFRFPSYITTSVFYFLSFDNFPRGTNWESRNLHCIIVEPLFRSIIHSKTFPWLLFIMNHKLNIRPNVLIAK